MVIRTSLTEHELVKIREALEKPTLTEAISAMEEVLTSLGYVRPGGQRRKDNPGDDVKLKTKVFELYNEKYTNLSELAQAMGISVSQIYRVRQGKRAINEKLIKGAVQAFPGYKLDDLFYIAGEVSQ